MTSSAQVDGLLPLNDCQFPYKIMTSPASLSLKQGQHAAMTGDEELSFICWDWLLTRAHAFPAKAGEPALANCSKTAMKLSCIL